MEMNWLFWGIGSFIVALLLSWLVVRELKKDKTHQYSKGQLIVIYIISLIILTGVGIGVKFLLNMF